MSRQFKKANYEETLKQTIRLEDALAPTHLARFVVDIVAELDLHRIYRRYGKMGGAVIQPEVLLALLFYGYATGVFSSRKIERATYESVPFRYIAGGLHPDHDTIAHFRKTFLKEIRGLFVQILVLAQIAGVLKLGNISVDGSKIHADASKSHAISFGRLIEQEKHLRQEVQELLDLGERADQEEVDLPESLELEKEVAIRQERLEKLAEARRVLEGRAQERFAQEEAEYAAKQKEREEKARKSGHKPRGPKPKPPEAGPREKDRKSVV
jgi:transposase